MSTPLSKEEILSKVADAVAEQKKIEASTVTLDSSFEELGVDSLDALEILFELEDGLDVDIPDEAARSMRTVDQVVDGLDKLIRGEEIVVPDPPAVTETKTEDGDTPPQAAQG